MTQHESRDARPDFMVRLGLLPPYTKEDIRKAFKAKAKTAHPDGGGNPVEFHDLREAYERALQYAEFRKSRRDWLAAQVERYTEHLELVDELESRGCILTMETEDWRMKSWGDFAQITEGILAIRAQGPAFDNTLAEILGNQHDLLTSLRLIDFSSSGLTDSGLRRLAVLSELLRIDVRNTAVSALGVRLLIGELQHLEAIHIGGTEINWLSRLELRRRCRHAEIITDMNVTLDCTPRTRYSHLAQMALD